MKTFSKVVTCALILGVAASSNAAELLAGQIELADDASTAFVLTGESREQVIGGEISFDGGRYLITSVSRFGLIGATRKTEPAEFVVFSSSFSSDEATGQPWVAAGSYHDCDRPYNSFLAHYRLAAGAESVNSEEVPYSKLTDDLEASEFSAVYCFSSAPP